LTAADRDEPPLLAIADLEVAFAGRHGWVPVVRGVSLSIRRGECVGLVGESGSGKSLTALAVLRLLPPRTRLRGRVLLDGRDLLALPEAAMRDVRGARIGISLQDSAAALDPFYTIGFQIAEAVAAHRTMTRRAARAEALRLLDRVVVAMALAGQPDLLLADEPTTALDVTLQAQVLALLDELRRDLGLAVLLITHDLAVVAETCDRVAVLYAGRVVEEASVAGLFAAPAHPYTRGLLATLPRLGHPAPRGRLPLLAGQPAEAWALPPGCAFHPRCPQAMAVCALEDPPEGPPLAADGAGAAGAGNAERWGGAAPRRLGPARRVRCWPPRAWKRNIHCAAPAGCRGAGAGDGLPPWRASILSCGAAKAWPWWASRAAARPPWRSACCA
jgi:peptide/nickel transport system ATP-binding protein